MAGQPQTPKPRIQTGRFLTLGTKTNTVSVAGIEQPDATLVSYTDGLLVIKVPGYSYSFSAHPSMDGRSYAQAEYQIWEVESFSVEGHLLHITARPRGSFPVRGAQGTFPIPTQTN